jgi:NAD(P)-dependent dehydrogenase (short-subunit alcohol dehydrogenase family)
MGELEGKVALITGAARGQGRSHAVALAEQGVDIIAVDLCRDIDTVSYALATAADLEETVQLVEKQGRRIVASPADVRDVTSLSAALEGGLRNSGGSTSCWSMPELPRNRCRTPTLPKRGPMSSTST